MHGYESSLDLCLPPLSVLVFRHDPARLQELEEGSEADLPL
jgi:1,4-alpha-glucan branching enzyme